MSRRESDVLAALADRLTNAEIASRLYLSERTVESHVTSLLRKLGARSRVELGDVARELHREESGSRPPLPAALALMVEATTFVGRAAELARLQDLWCRAAAGRMLVVLVAGEAGMGKSRLVAELAAHVYDDGAHVAWGACFEDVPTPYQPFAQAISADVAALPDVELRRRVSGAGQRLALVVPELAAAAPVTADVVDPRTAQAEVFAGLHSYLARTAERGPLLLVVEDVHWATSTTLGALRHLARVSSHAPVLVAVTSRDRPPDVGDELAVVLADLGGLPSVERIDLAGLGEREVADLLGTLGAAADAAAVRAQTDGNPLFVREVAGSATGRTGSVRALLSRRYALLDPRDLALLDVAAVAGPEFDADLLAAAGYPLPAVLESLERVEAAGIVVRAPGRPGRFSFVHALFRAARYDDIAEDRRGELHLRIVGALRERADDERVLPELARHASLAPVGHPKGAAGDLAERARQALRDEGDRALALNDFGAAARAYQGALRLWPAVHPDRPSLLLGLGRAMFTAARQGADVLTEARDGLLALGDAECAADAEMMLGELDWIGSRWAAATGHFDRAAALVADRPPSATVARVIADLAKFRMIQGANREARAYGARALAMARDLGLGAVEVATLATIGATRVAEGDLGGVGDLETGAALAEALNSPEVSRCYSNLSFVHVLLGDLRLAHEWRRRCGEAEERFGMVDGVRWARAHDIEHHYYLGRWDEALAAADAFVAEVESSAHYLVAVALRMRARMRIARGNPIGGLADAAAAAEFARGAQNQSTLLVALPFHAWCLLETGRAGDADAVISEALKAATGRENILDPIDTAIAMWGLGRQAEYLDVAGRVTLPSQRWDVGRAIVGGHLERAADLLAGQEHRSFEAYVRLLAAEHLAARGRRAAAEAQVRQALAFHRSVGATAYVSRAERLLAGLR